MAKGKKSKASEPKVGKDGGYTAAYLATLSRDQLIKQRAADAGKPELMSSLDLELSKRLIDVKVGDSDGEEIWSGLMKYRDALKIWHERYFVLTPEKLMYYKLVDGKPPAERASAKHEGLVLLSGCQVAVRDSKVEANCLKITHPSRKAHVGSMRKYDYLILAVPSAEAMAHWIAAIETSIIFASAVEDGVARVADRKIEPAKDDEHGAMVDEDSEGGDDSGSESPMAEEVLDVPDKPLPKRRKKSGAAKASPLPRKKGGGKKGGGTGGDGADGDEEEEEEDDDDIEGDEEAVAAASAALPPATTYELAVPAVTVDNIGTGAAQEEVKSEYKSVAMEILKQLRPGVDLSKVTLPAFILEPRSTLEMLSEKMSHADTLLLNASKPDDPLLRLKNVVRFYLSGFYIKPAGVKKPYNPIIDERFRCMWQHEDGSRSFYIAEQVSHHPPISAFYFQNRKAGIVASGSILFGSKFMGTYAASTLTGVLKLRFIDRDDEEYELTFPNAHAKGFIIGPLVMEMVGRVTVACKKTGLQAELDFKSKPFFGGEYNVLSGRVTRIGKPKEVLHRIAGKWDDRLTWDNETLWDPRGQTRAAVYKPVWEEMDEKESDKLWEKVTEGLKNEDVRYATKYKTELENAQRALHKQLKEEGRTWVPRLFEFEEGTKNHYNYKHANMTPWDASKEVLEYEHEGVIQSVTVEQHAAARAAVSRSRRRGAAKKDAAADGDAPASPAGGARKETGGGSGKKRAKAGSEAAAATAGGDGASPKSAKRGTKGSVSAGSGGGSKLKTAAAAVEEAVASPVKSAVAKAVSAGGETVSELLKRIDRLESKVSSLTASHSSASGGSRVDARLLIATFVVALYLVGSYNILRYVWGE